MLKVILFVSSCLFSCVSYAATYEVNIKKFKFEPALIELEKGDRVIWINKEKRQYHNVWFKTLDKQEPGYLFPDERYQKVFNDEGRFDYECGPHPEMKGRIVVNSSSTKKEK